MVPRLMYMGSTSFRNGGTPPVPHPSVCPRRGRSAWTGIGNSCYRARMAKTQLGARVDEDVAELARKRAADLGMSVGDYLARLVQDDASGLRARGVEAAARFLADHQAVFDEAEDAQRSGEAQKSGEVRAA